MNYRGNTFYPTKPHLKVMGSQIGSVIYVDDIAQTPKGAIILLNDTYYKVYRRDFKRRKIWIRPEVQI